MRIREYQILVERAKDGSYWFTAQFRNICFLFDGPWHDLYPKYQPTYDHASYLIEDHKAKN